MDLSSYWFLPKLADHLWQATLIGLTILLAVHLLSRQSARLRHSLLLLAMAKFLFPAPLLVSALDVVGIRRSDLFPSLSSKAVSYFQPSVRMDTSPLRPAALTKTSSSNAPAVWFVLASIWVLGLLFLTISSVRRNRRVKALVANAPRVAAGREFEAMRRVAGWMSLRGSVELAMPVEFLEAGVWGTRNPVLLLPA